MAHEKLKQAIGNLADVEGDAQQSDVTQPTDLARCAEATRSGFEAILAAFGTEQADDSEVGRKSLEWISVRTRMPPFNEPVLVWCERSADYDAGVGIGYRNIARAVSPDPMWFVEFNERAHDEDENPETYITFWMKLPAPPVHGKALGASRVVVPLPSIDCDFE